MKISDFCKATAPFWLFCGAFGISMIGVFLIVFGSIIHLYIGIGLMLAGWATLGIGLGPALDASRRVFR